ncbi:MAG: DNA methyltransferase [Acidobacteriota bacterium]
MPVRESHTRSNPFEDIESAPSSHASIQLAREDFILLLGGIEDQDDIAALRSKTAELKQMIASHDGAVFADAGSNGNVVSLRTDVLASELDQILEARTIERAKYYVKRLERGVKKVKTSKINDINLHRWKEHTDIITDSLWVLPKRDSAGAHLASYWGNFIPQIPHQLMLRYTKKGDWVLDPFVGSGTTLIECRRLGRNGIGIELNSGVANQARELVGKENNRYSVRTEIVAGDARKIDALRMMDDLDSKRVQLLIMHPPYHDIISFSEDCNDLSNAATTDEFLKMFGEALDNIDPVLERGRYFALVVGDKYSKGEWIPLGFHCMSEVLKRAYSLKSIVVKNFEETRAKRDQKQLWRYRALAGGFYIFKHEYIFIFKKK